MSPKDETGAANGITRRYASTRDIQDYLVFEVLPAKLSAGQWGFDEWRRGRDSSRAVLGIPHYIVLFRYIS
jgi:hypothetical protein